MLADLNKLFLLDKKFEQRLSLVEKIFGPNKANKEWYEHEASKVNRGNLGVTWYTFIR